MAKMSLERFNKIKKIVAEIADLMKKIEDEEIQLSSEEQEKAENELEQTYDEIHTSDLSDIPFEEYDGFYNLGFDFSGTGANIDLNIINIDLLDGSVKLKGCNVRNFDFEHQNYDEESFDEEFMQEHSDKFIDRNLPEMVRKRYYWKSLEIQDIIKYDLYDEIENGKVSKEASRFFEKVKPDVAKSLDPDLIDIHSLNYSIVREILNYEEEITESVIEDIVREKIEQTLSSNYLNTDVYKKIIRNPQTRELISEKEIIDFEEDDELASKYIKGEMSLNDIYNKQEIFEKKSFLSRLSRYNYYPESLEGISEEKIFYMFEKFPDIASEMINEETILFNVIKSIDIEQNEEENLKNVTTQIVEILNSDYAENLNPDTKKILERYYSMEVLKSRLSEDDLSEIENIMKYTTEEKIESYGITPKILENESVRALFSEYGLETVMEFDKANGNIFSKNDFELAKKIDEYYFHYAANIHDINRTIYYRTEKPEDFNAPYTSNDFEECVRRMIVEGPTDGNYSQLQPIDFRNFSQEFKDKFPRMFLSKDAPQELQDKFYTKLLI